MSGKTCGDLTGRRRQVVEEKTEEVSWSFSVQPTTECKSGRGSRRDGPKNRGSMGYSTKMTIDYGIHRCRSQVKRQEQTELEDIVHYTGWNRKAFEKGEVRRTECSATDRQRRRPRRKSGSSGDLPCRGTPVGVGRRETDVGDPLECVGVASLR